MYTEAQLPQLIGRVVKYNLEAMTPLLESMLLNEGEVLPTGGSPWALNIPPGMVAVSIPINRLSSISYAPRPGDHVNVIATLLFVDLDTDFQTILPNRPGLVISSGPPNPETGERDPLTVQISTEFVGKTVIDPVLGQAVYVIPSESQRARMASQMLLQDVVVLNIGEFPLEEEVQATPTPEGGVTEEQQPGQAPAEPPKPDMITLVVRPQDAIALNYLIYAGSQLSLALRGANDDSRVTVNPVTLQFLLEQYQIPVPVRLPYGTHPRTDGLTGPTFATQAAPSP
jgi:pilus assembly protein CpaB